MNFGINPYEAGFTLLSPVVAVFLWRKQNLPMLVSVAFGCALVSWLLLFAADIWIDQQWFSLMERTPNPSEELIREFNSDGASKAATLILGLPFSLAYFLLCFLVVRSAQWFWGKVRNAQQLAQPDSRR